MIQARNRSNTLKKKIEEVQEFKNLAQQVPDLKSKVATLEQEVINVRESDLDDSSLFQIISKDKLSSSVNYLIDMLDKKDREIQSLRTASVKKD